MGILTNLNFSLIEKVADHFFKERGIKSWSQHPYITTIDYEPKLRDAVVRFTYADKFQSDSDSPEVSVKAYLKSKNTVEFCAPKKISNPIDCKEMLDQIWLTILKEDKAKFGNLDDFDQFNYLDTIFEMAHQIILREKESGVLAYYSNLDNYVRDAQHALKTSYEPDMVKSDICKLVSEKNILEKYSVARLKKSLDIDDSIFLEARVLVESEYPGITNFKKRKF